MHSQDYYYSKLLDSLPLPDRDKQTINEFGVKDPEWKKKNYNIMIRNLTLNYFIHNIFDLTGASLLNKIQELHSRGVAQNLDYPEYLKKVESLLNLQNDVTAMIPIPKNV